MEFISGFLLAGAISAWLFVWSIKSPEYPYNYHVVYCFEKDKTSTGSGAMNVKRSHEIKTSNDVNNVREFIEKENKFEKVVILNWIKLK